MDSTLGTQSCGARSRPAGASGPAAVLAVKRLREAKSRLAASLSARHPGPDVSRLVLGMMLDTIDALHAAGVERVVVVSPDREVLTAVGQVGCAGLLETGPPAPGSPGDPSQTGLNRAFGHGVRWARTAWPEAERTILIQADLPAATPESIGEVLATAAGHEQAVLADRAGTGTVLLIRPTGARTPPRFGPGSAAAHRVDGAVELDPERRRWADLRLDVDTAADLEDATAIGLGRHTAAALRAPG